MFPGRRPISTAQRTDHSGYSTQCHKRRQFVDSQVDLSLATAHSKVSIDNRRKEERLHNQTGGSANAPAGHFRQGKIWG